MRSWRQRIDSSVSRRQRGADTISGTPAFGNLRSDEMRLGTTDETPADTLGNFFANRSTARMSSAWCARTNTPRCAALWPPTCH
jgi:hypothetical protein